MKKKLFIYLFAFGHLCSDINQTALSALLPFLIASYHFDYVTAAMLVLSANIIGSFVQPLLGQFADKKNAPWVMAVGLMLAGGGIAVTGLIPNFAGLCVAVMISGIGVAMFHPQAAKLVNYASDDSNRGMSLSVFSFGGNLGQTLGPIVITGAIGLFGIKGTLVFFIPECIACAFIAFVYRKLKAFGYENELPVRDDGASASQDAQRDDWTSFAKLSLVMFGRSIVHYGLNTFLALYWVSILGQDKAVANSLLSFYFGFGTLCTLIGGKLADKFGYRIMIRAGVSLSAPCIFLFTLTRNVYVAAFLLLPIAAANSIVYSPMVVLGQKYLPRRVGLASGVTLGLAVSVGGIFAPVLGKVADIFGLVTTMNVIALIAIVPIIGAMLLKETENDRAHSKAACGPV